jgi:hypothetical protein
LDFFVPHLLSGPGQNHTHIDTNDHDEDDGWKTFSVQSHCFKVKMYGSTISKYGNVGLLETHHKNNRMSSGDCKMLFTPPPSSIVCRELQRIVWFCHKVWHFDFRTSLNRKEIIISSMPKPRPMVGTMFYAWEVQI